MIRAIIFDCFGVLCVDAFKEFVEHYAATAEDAHYYYQLRLAADRGLVPEAEFYAQLAEFSGQTPTAIRHRVHDTSVLNRPLVPLIEALRPHYQLGLLSNADRKFLDKFLAAGQITDLFHNVVASSDTPYVKPQREIFEHAVAQLNVEFAETLFIDDSPTNVAAAQAYGLPSIHYQDLAQLQGQLAARHVVGY